MNTRKIIHVDMDAFYASVEQRDNPELVGKPVIVGGRPEQRGVVAACSYEARAYGVHSAMPSSRALKLCKNAVFISPRFDAYREASRQIHQIFSQFTRIIEPLSLDEAYLDVTSLTEFSSSATEIAQLIKQLIKEQVKLTASAGVSYNKFLAKIASDMDKPDGLTVIRPEQAQAFISQLKIRQFHGIGKVTEKKMQALGVFTGADLRQLSQLQLQTHFGSVGNYYYHVARGVDERPVSASRTRKSISSETTFNQDLTDKKQIWQTLQHLSADLEQSLRKKQLYARTITLKVRYANFQLITRSKTLEVALHSQQQMLAVLPQLLKKTAVGERAIRLIGINLANFVDKDYRQANKDSQQNPQLGLF